VGTIKHELCSLSNLSEFDYGRPLYQRQGAGAISFCPLDIRFKKELSAEEITTAVNRLETKMRDRHPEIRHVFIEAKSLS